MIYRIDYSQFIHNFAFIISRNSVYFRCKASKMKIVVLIRESGKTNEIVNPKKCDYIYYLFDQFLITPVVYYNCFENYVTLQCGIAKTFCFGYKCLNCVTY